MLTRSTVWAQTDTAKSSDPPYSERALVGAPFLSYSPETGIGAGAAGLFYFHIHDDSSERSDNRPSMISLGFTYTQKNQISTGSDYALYFDHNKYYIFGGWDYKKIPFDFFGIGNYNSKDATDNYTPLWRGGDVLITRNILEIDSNGGLSAGLGTEYRYDLILSSKSGGPLQSGNVPGASGGLSAGFGWIVSVDTRDNVFSTHSGYYADLRTYYYGKAVGSSFNFNRTSLDAREFIPVFTTHTLALQGLVTLVKGVEPFYTMAALGGISNMRGYFEGRFRDNDMTVLQAEYRAPVFWRIGVVGFADAGEVAGTMGEFKLTGFKYSVGAGIRLFLSQEERVVARLDFGFGSDSNEIYFAVNEAF
ncbi:MAG TPA: BamA/TamA family outer membrane protein [Candidatus Kapabacteria bacterium]|nr:BamA/TamA family outer membrane protein [Candidatus Kapabacteria bacterium]